MMSKKVSVIIPICNVEKYLVQCLNSVVNQTLKELEIICIDDGSTDSSGDILDCFAKTDPRIKVLHKTNAGVGAAMNDGLKMASGEYIGIVESDDYADENMFERLYGIAKEYDVDYVKSDFWLVEDGQKKRKNIFASTKIDCGCLFGPKENMNKLKNSKAIWSAIYKRSFLEKNEIVFLETPGASYQDTSFWFKVAITAEKAYMLDEPYLNYRINDNSSVRSKNKVYNVCEEIDECLRYLEEHNRYDFLPVFWKYKFDTYMWNVNRLENESRHQFLKRFSEDFLNFNLDDMRNLQELFSSNDLEFIELIKKNEVSISKAYEFCDANHGGYRLNEVETYERVYIYGAGKYGMRLKDDLLKANPDCEIKMVVSRNVNKNPDLIEIGYECINKDVPIIIAIANYYSRIIMTASAIDAGFDTVFLYY